MPFVKGTLPGLLYAKSPDNLIKNCKAYFEPVLRKKKRMVPQYKERTFNKQKKENHAIVFLKGFSDQKYTLFKTKRQRNDRLKLKNDWKIFIQIFRFFFVKINETIGFQKSENESFPLILMILYIYFYQFRCQIKEGSHVSESRSFWEFSKNILFFR